MSITDILTFSFTKDPQVTVQEEDPSVASFAGEYEKVNSKADFQKFGDPATPNQ